MWKGTLRGALRLTLVASMAAPASAQSTAVRLSLDDAIARGLDVSHRLAELDARLEAAEALAAGQGAAGRPQLAVQAGFMRTNHIDAFGIPQPSGPLRVIFPDLPNNYRTRLDLEWPIYTAGRTDALQRAARAEAAAAGEDREAARADLRLEITRAYWALVTARETVRVVEEALARVDAHLADVRNQLAAGLIPPNEVLSVEAQRAREQVLLIEARNQQELAAADLRRLTGLPADTPIDLASELAEGAPPEAPVDTLIDRARAARSERQALDERAAAAAARGEAVLAGRGPQVVVAGGVDYARPNPRILPRQDEWQESWDLAVNVSFSLWDGGRITAQATEVQASLRALRARLAEFDSRLDLEIRQRRFDLDASLAAVRASEAAVRAAAEARRVVSERFEAGVATSTDVLDAQVALFQTELDRTRALANSRLARARLDRAQGQ